MKNIKMSITKKDKSNVEAIAEQYLQPTDGLDGRNIEIRNTDNALEWRYEDERNWTELVSHEEIRGPMGPRGPQGAKGEKGATGKKGADGKDGEDGKSVQLRKTKQWIEWRQEGGEWKKLVSINELTGPAGTTNIDIIGSGGGGGAGGGGTIKEIIAGDNIAVDNTDPAYPIITAVIPPDAGVMLVHGGDGMVVDNTNTAQPIVAIDPAYTEAIQEDIEELGDTKLSSVVAGDNIEVDNTDPLNPVVSATPQSVYLLTGMFTNADADVSPYKYAKPLTDFVAGAEASTVVSITTSETLLKTFISQVGRPGVTYLPAGVLSCYFDVERDSGSSSYHVFAKIYKRAANGTETLLFTTENSSTYTTGRQNVRVNANNPSGLSVLITDRVVVKIYAVATASSPNIRIYYDGNSNSRLMYPTVVADSSVFMPANAGLEELSDVDLSAPFFNGYFLGWDATNNQWINKLVSYGQISGTPNLAAVATGGLYQNLTNVDVTGIGDDWIMAWDADLNKWTARASAPSSGSVAWGAITGTITAQTDLVNAFMRKSGSVTETITGIKTFNNLAVNNSTPSTLPDATIGLIANTGSSYSGVYSRNSSFGDKMIIRNYYYDGRVEISGSAANGQHDFDVALGSHYNHATIYPQTAGMYWVWAAGVMNMMFKGGSRRSASTTQAIGMTGEQHNSSYTMLKFGVFADGSTYSFTEYFRIQNVSGTTPTVLFNGSTILSGLMTPTASSHAATKGYVDGVAFGGGSTTPTFDTVTVDDDAYDSGWDGDLTVPTKNAIWDVLGDIEAALDAILG